MHKFIMLDGSIVCSETYMKGPSTKHAFYNVSKLDDNYSTWVEGVSLETIDPNINFLFGYEESEFMRKQYK